jgi:hypothetical protein
MPAQRSDYAANVAAIERMIKLAGDMDHVVPVPQRRPNREN